MKSKSMHRWGRFLVLLSAVLALILSTGCGSKQAEAKSQNKNNQTTESTVSAAADTAAGQDSGNAKSGLTVDENGTYTSKDEVALYIHTYGHLPSNFVTKKDAKDSGWPGHGSLGQYLPGKSLGGSRFGNYEGALPEKEGRVYYECDIDYDGGSRNAKRIVYSNDGLVYYTEDHYTTFEQLY
jgi:guanyl-specific ribonuclease Sa